MDLLYYGQDNIVFPREGDCGYDLRSNESRILGQFDAYVFHIDVHLSIPDGYFGKIMERSSLGAAGIAVRGGVIDPSYRGTIGVTLQNLNNHQFMINKGDKIAQIVFIPYETFPLKKVENLEDLGETIRGEGAFGSTGRK